MVSSFGAGESEEDDEIRNEHFGPLESTDNEHSSDVESTENEGSDEPANFHDDTTEKRIEEVALSDEDGRAVPCESKVDFSLQSSQHVQQPKPIGYPGVISASA